MNPFCHLALPAQTFWRCIAVSLSLGLAFLLTPIEANAAQNGNIGLGRSAPIAQKIRPKLEAQARERGLEIGSPVFVRIFKEEKELEVWLQGDGNAFHLFQVYPICYFSGLLGPKVSEGDRQTPEGFYHVTADRLNPWSQFHLAFNIGFPNAYDRHHNRTGSALMVHGNCVSIGCYAMSDPAIEEIYVTAEAALAQGQPFFRVHAFPFRMTDDNMADHASSPWHGFWKNLKKGYDHFESKKQPPDVNVQNGIYIFR